MILVQRIQADIYVKGELYNLSNRPMSELSKLTTDEFKQAEKSKFEELGINNVEITLTYTQL